MLVLLMGVSSFSQLNPHNDKSINLLTDSYLTGGDVDVCIYLYNFIIKPLHMLTSHVIECPNTYIPKARRLAKGGGEAQLQSRRLVS